MSFQSQMISQKFFRMMFGLSNLAIFCRVKRRAAYFARRGCGPPHILAQLPAAAGGPPHHCPPRRAAAGGGGQNRSSSHITELRSNFPCRFNAIYSAPASSDSSHSPRSINSSRQVAATTDSFRLASNSLKLSISAKFILMLAKPWTVLRVDSIASLR